MSAVPSSARPDPAQLYFHFPCAECSRPLSLPVLQLEARRLECRSCGSVIETPELARETAGVAEILQLFSTKVESACPRCHRKLRAAADQLGKRRRCPSCRTFLSLALVADGAAEAQRAPRSSQERPVTDERPGRRRQPESRASSAHRGPPADSRRSHRQSVEPEEVAPPAGFPQIPEPPDPEVGHDEPAPVVYQAGGATSAVTESRSRRSGLFSSPRTVFWILYLLIHVGPFFVSFPVVVLGDVTSNRPLVEAMTVVAGLSCLWLPFGWYPARVLARWITPLLVSTFRCPHCHEEYEMVSRWTCGCGFTDHRDRHALRFRCPKCQGLMGYYDCKRCGSTIILRTRFG